MARFSVVDIPAGASFADAVREGLSRRPKAIPPRFFYDDRGSALFERICALPEYYVTRTEWEILQRCAAEIAPSPTVVEFGGGSGAKTALILETFFRTAAAVTYRPVDISTAALEQSGRSLLEHFPGLTVRAFRAEFDQAPLVLPRERSLVLFLGSNIGNFDPEGATRFLASLRGHRVLAGFDMRKDPAVLHAAYNDVQGITAEFNLNLLARINRELGGGFPPGSFRHRAFFNEAEGRIEMHLVSVRAQTVPIQALGTEFRFDEGESIHTENSYKFTPDQIRSIAVQAGFRVERGWSDGCGWFTVAQLEPSP